MYVFDKNILLIILHIRDSYQLISGILNMYVLINIPLINCYIMNHECIK